ncbi:MAG TPA: type II CAAX endopeptidase family protein [Mucilaginibacter sp.]|nr:type II CAAX endopeptidase family protein [Mucilaginibacter sp.]
MKISLQRLPPWLKILLFISCFTGLLVIAGFLRFFVPPPFHQLAFGVLGSGGGLFTIWLFSKLRAFSYAEAGIRLNNRSPLKFLLGVIIGLVFFLMLLMAFIGLTPASIRFSGHGFSTEALLQILALLPLALMEEIAFRSYPQQELNQRYGVWVSQVVMALVFGFYHILYGWDPLTAFTGPFVWAFLFGLAAIVSRGIALPLGIHFSLNAGQLIAGLNGTSPAALWVISYPRGMAQAVQQQSQLTGMLLHGVLWIILLLLTYYWNRRQKKVAKLTHH